MAPPQANGLMWVLDKVGGAANVQTLNLATGSSGGTVAVSADASTLTDLSTGTLLVGTATPTTGSVEIRNGTTGALSSNLALSGPVRALAPGADGTTAYALVKTARTAAVDVVDTRSAKVVGTVPVSAGTVAIAGSNDGADVFGLSPDGSVSEYATAGGQPTASFSVGHSGVAMVMSPSGASLYVLKGQGPVRNVAIVHVATEQVTEAIAAPAAARSLAVSQDGSTLYDGVGTPAYGNVQAFGLSATG